MKINSHSVHPEVRLTSRHYSDYIPDPRSARQTDVYPAVIISIFYLIILLFHIGNLIKQIKLISLFGKKKGIIIIITPKGLIVI